MSPEREQRGGELRRNVGVWFLCMGLCFPACPRHTAARNPVDRPAGPALARGALEQQGEPGLQQQVARVVGRGAVDAQGDVDAVVAQAPHGADARGEAQV